MTDLTVFENARDDEDTAVCGCVVPADRTTAFNAAVSAPEEASE